MPRNWTALALLVIAVAGAGVLATAVDGHATGSFWGGPESPCRAVLAEDCTVSGEVWTSTGRAVSEDVELHLLFGPRSVLAGNVSVSPSGDPVIQVSGDVHGPYGRTTTVVEAGTREARYDTPSIGGHVDYVVVAALSNTSDWTVRTADATSVPRVHVLSDLGSYRGAWTEQRGGRAAVATVSLDDPPPPLVNFELRPSSGEGVAPGGAGPGTFVSDSYLAWAIFVLALGLGVVVVGSGLAVRRRDSADDLVEYADEASELGRIAGDVADAIEHEAADANAVYRAWDEMTAALDVTDPETTSPREFAEAAVDAGLSPDDVDALTDLFEAVRYGDADPTAHEDEALATLRRVEEAYATADEPGEGDDP